MSTDGADDDGADRRDVLAGEVLAALRGLRAAAEDVDRAVAECMGVNQTDQRCLQVLDERGPLTAGQLAQASALSSGAATTAIDRLELAGYVRRRRDADDRRRVLVDLTDTARRERDRLYGPVFSAARGLLEGCTAAELLTVRDLLRSQHETHEQHALRLRARARRQAQAVAPVRHGRPAGPPTQGGAGAA